MKQKSFSDLEYPSVSTVITVLFSLYVVVWYLQVGSRWTRLGEIRFEFWLAFCLIILSIFNLSGYRRTSSGHGIYPYLTLFFLSIIVQIPFSANFDISWKFFIDRILKFAAMSLFIIAFVRSPNQLKWFIGAFLLACMKIGQEGLHGVVTGHMMWENQGVMRLHGATRLIAHPNSLAGNALGTIPFIVYLFSSCPRSVRALFLIQLIFAINIIIHTGSRTGYIGFLFCLVFLVYKNRKKIPIKYYLIGCIALLISLPLIPDQYVERFESIFTGEEKEGKSTQARIEIVKDAVQIITENPAGVGVAAFSTVRYQKFGRSQNTHNLYLGVSADLGIQGLIIFLLLIIKILKTLGSLQKDMHGQIERLSSVLNREHFDDKYNPIFNTHIKDLRMMLEVVSAVLLFLLIRLVVGIFGMDLYDIYWWFIIGLTIALYNMNKVANSKTQYFLNLSD